ncbi:hypothetical protein [Neopusillimonas maritima]|jgi:hypothetical protein|uniref:DUF7226 domain-containing protein n=1 Tax=Neopusillimonas maritima TaxID=2026239 RepID=A0ABX9MY33_9BURK|nr:hypothetical protein [Neopusillimonas maritima]RII83862.1 hypothetical protein CJO09_01055 [Neopusillimonas maritima]
MVATSDFPQADRLEQVGQVAIAIANGKRADEEIEAAIGLDSDGRQGRYYRHAAEVLGLIVNRHNNAVLTALGKEFASLSSRAARIDFLARCLLETPVFYEALCYIHQHHPNDAQLKRWFRVFYPGAESTADRRFHTFISYLCEAGLLQSSSNKNHVKKYVGSLVKKSITSTRSLTGRNLKKSLPSLPPTAGQGSIRVDVNLQKLERANQIHWQLVDAKSSFLDDRGLEPYANEHIDLYSDNRGDIIIYEMKSVDAEGANFLSQIRKAVSQLYEYRYIYEEPNARLCIVTNHGIAKKDEWLLDYLARDRVIAYEWTDDFANFECRHDAASLLGDFSPCFNGR